MDREKYPPNWESISYNIRFVRAKGRCECTGICGLHEGKCGAIHNLPHPITRSRVILTTAHLDQDPSHGDPDRLLALCQRCHLSYDRNYYKSVRMAWIKTLSNNDLFALAWACEVANAEFMEDITQEFSDIYDALESECNERIEMGEMLL